MQNPVSSSIRTKLQENKTLQALGIPFSALMSIIFGVMLCSFPIGAYIFFNSDVGSEINYEYPLHSLDFFVAGMSVQIPIEFEIGDVFIVIWCIYAIIFSIAMFGPKKNFFLELAPIMNHGKNTSSSNYMVSMIKWFTILILTSAIINIAQESIGITTEPPISENDLIQFFDVTKAPLIEEIGFRVLLVGVPLFAIYSHKSSIKHFFKSLWHPYENLHVDNKTKAIALIVLVAVFFGVAHIISGEAWSSGKFAQATASGIIIGWVYFRYGLAPALLIHWATNYFIFSYVYLIADINFVTISEAFSHSMLLTFEIIFVIGGIISVAMMIIHRKNSQKEEKLQI